MKATSPFVKQNDCGVLGLFSGQSYEPGQIILDEVPIIARSLRAASTDVVTEIATIGIPCRYPGHLSEQTIVSTGIITQYRATEAMVCAAECYAAAEPREREQCLSLHYPELDDPHPLVGVTREVAVLCARREWAAGLCVEELHRAILVFELNSFSAHELYATACRMNHACDPSVIFAPPTPEGTRLYSAARPIAAGEELTVNYLGHRVWQSTFMRQRCTWQTKMFVCMCKACSRLDDPFRDVPCPTCKQGRGRFVVAEERWHCQACGGIFGEDLRAYEWNLCGRVAEYHTQISLGHKVDDTMLAKYFLAAGKLLGRWHWGTNLMLFLIMEHLQVPHALPPAGSRSIALSHAWDAADSIGMLWEFMTHCLSPVMAAQALWWHIKTVAAALNMGDEAAKQRSAMLCRRILPWMPVVACQEDTEAMQQIH